jgi:uncharacterized protein YqeY
MSLSERVQEELKAAMRARDKARTGALRLIRAALLEEEKSGSGAVSDDAAVTVLRRMRKQREESAAEYDRGGRPELAEQERAELSIIDTFLPQLADEATTRGWVEAAIASSGASSKRDLGRVMGAVMKAHRGDVDAGLARSIADSLLA